jgi:hypothetical protein
MSNKAAVIEMIQTLPDDITLEGIITILQGECARAKSSEGQSPEELEWSAEELSDEEWALFATQAWEESLNDPREDIYTLDDGEPVESNLKQSPNP